MTTFNYVVAKFVPDLVKNEPVNIGVIVQDSKTKIAYGKFIDNFRVLGQRYHEINVNALKMILDSFRGEFKINSDEYLENLSKEFRFQLVFAEPSGVVAGSTHQASEELFHRFISIERARKIQSHITKPQLRRMVTVGIKEVNFDRSWVRSKPIVAGKIGHFAFDYGFKNGKIRDLVHTISFDGKAESALRDSKALAISVEDARSKDDELACTAIIHPPHDEKIFTEYYEPAVGYLKDKECEVKDEDHIKQYLLTVKSRLTQYHHN